MNDRLCTPCCHYYLEQMAVYGCGEIFDPLCFLAVRLVWVAGVLVIVR